MILKFIAPIISCLLLIGVTSCKTRNSEDNNSDEVIVIDQIWAGCAADYAIITKPPNQFVAYYDSAHYLTVAQRKLQKKIWVKTRLETRLEWDAHNYVAMAFDKKGFLHVSANMHGDTLIYFQAEKPFDASSLKRKYSLIGNEENSVTYPQFFPAPDGDLIFSYRSGYSSRGNQIYNRYNAEKQQWSRLLDVPLVDGEGKSNAYLHGPIVGPDGYFHLIWVWRIAFDANANCMLSYARSKDLINWEKSDGSVQKLPITMSNCEIIDPIPAYHGLLNGNTKIGFDHQNRVIVSYHKNDEKGNIQIYNARREKGGWKIYQATDWNWKWNFGGWGSIIARVGLSEVSVEDNKLTQTIYVDSVGIQKFTINEENLKTVSRLEKALNYPDSLRNLSGKLELAQVNIIEDSSNEYGTYILRWETLKRNGDKPYDFIPKSQPLELYHFQTKKLKQ